MTLRPEDIVVYVTDDPRRKGKSFLGRFCDGDRELPMTFSAPSRAELTTMMTKWLMDERERIAKQDATREYLRSPEMIEKRRESMKAAREARKAKS